MSDESKVSQWEIIKRESDYLRGGIGEELTDGNDYFGKSTIQLLKFHGAYQQDDRDARRAVRVEGKSGKSYIFLVRTKMPGGKLLASQLLAELDLCDELGNSTLRITTRQGFQLHGVLKRNVKEAIARINEVQLTTLGACGDVERNVMCCPAPYATEAHRRTQELADRISDHLSPRTRAYHELWLEDSEGGGRRLVGGGRPEGEVEPIYGRQYLPRKFKTAIGFAYDNCVDIHAHDLGLLAIVEEEEIAGYNVLAGGGMGVTPSARKTFPALSKPVAFVTPEQAVEVATAVVQVLRDYGNRSDRKTARLKYLIHQWGVERFKEEVERRLGTALPDPRPVRVHGFHDHMGWGQQGDGRWFYGLNVENGRIGDFGDRRLKSALREICRRYEPGFRLTPHQSILITDLAEGDRSGLEAILREHGVPLVEEISTVRRWSMACVAWPTCGLAITESERVLPGVIDKLEAELNHLGLDREQFTVRMTGCPNGCARPYNADIGLVGRAKGRYTIFLGGRRLGDRLNFIYKDLTPLEEIVPSLSPLLVYYKEQREEGESFGDFCHRKGRDDLLEWSEQGVSETAR